MSMSSLELRHIIESGFLPMKCRCTVDHNGGLAIELIDPPTAANLVIGGIAITSLQTSRDIANLIAQLKAEISAAASKIQRVRA